jgi:transposase
LIERAYTEGQRRGLEVWGEDEAGPFQTMPYPGASWAPEGHPVRQPHEYQRDGTAKLLTLFHPRDGHVGVKGVTSSANVILHPWLTAELSAILAMLPDLPDDRISAANRAEWLVWQEGLTQPITLPAELPRLRMRLIWDNLAGHSTPELVLWLFSHGIMPLYTPLGGSWLNMTESVQRILKRRALEGQYPKTADEIITWLEATARGWNRAPTPFVWGGKRALRRARWRVRGHVAGGSGACARQPIRRRRCSMSGSQPSNCRPSPHAGSFTNNEQWQYTS